MALIATTGPIPKDAVKLTRAEAVNYQWRQINEWPERSEVWPFHWGLSGLATIAAGAGAQINRMYRMKLKLRQFGFVTTSFPMIVAPAMFAGTLHAQVVTNDLFLRETKCPLCLQYKAALIQVTFSIFYPIVMSPITNFLYASRHATYRVPYYTDVRETLALWWKFTKPMGYTLFAIGFIQALAASVVTYYEAESLYNLQVKLEMERQEVMLEEKKTTSN